MIDILQDQGLDRRDGEQARRNSVCAEGRYPPHFLNLGYMWLEEIKEHQLEVAKLEAVFSKDRRFP